MNYQKRPIIDISPLKLIFPVNRVVVETLLRVRRIISQLGTSPVLYNAEITCPTSNTIAKLIAGDSERRAKHPLGVGTGLRRKSFSPIEHDQLNDFGDAFVYLVSSIGINPEIVSLEFA